MADYRCSDREIKEYLDSIDLRGIRGIVTCCSADNPEDARETMCDGCPAEDDCSGPVEERQDTPGQMMLFPEVAS